MSTTSHYTIRYDRDWTWLEFPNWDVHTYDPLTKDTQNAVKEAIKQYCQMRWSRGNKQWYAKAVIPEEKIRRVIEDAREMAMAITDDIEMHLVNRIIERAEATGWEVKHLGPTWNQWQLVTNRKPVDEPLRATRIKAGESIYSDVIVETSEASAATTAATAETGEESLEVWKLATDQVYTTLFEFLDQQDDPARNEIDALDFATQVRDKYHVVNDDRGWVLETYESARPEDWKYLYRAAAPPVDDYQDIQWAQGLTVFAPVVVPDKEDHTLIMLQMIGPAESVKANWAALMSSGAVRYVNSCQIALVGMKDHIGLNIKLPCGHMESWLIHKQASFTEMSPEKGLFYVTSFSAEGDGPPKDMFFAMLDKLLAIPMLADWTDYLWREGEIKDLIVMIEPTHCRGSHAWKVKLDYEIWDTIIKGGVSSGQIKF
jgi:hypothetical protein